MHKQNEITLDQKSRIKDLIVQWDPSIQDLTKDINRLRQNLLEMACSYSDNADSKQTKITPRSQIRPNIHIMQSNKKWASKSSSSLSSPLDHKKPILL